MAHPDTFLPSVPVCFHSTAKVSNYDFSNIFCILKPLNFPHLLFLLEKQGVFENSVFSIHASWAHKIILQKQWSVAYKTTKTITTTTTTWTKSFGLWRRPAVTIHKIKELKSAFYLQPTSSFMKSYEMEWDQTESVSLLFLIYFNLLSQRQPLRQIFIMSTHWGLSAGIGKTQ